MAVSSWLKQELDNIHTHTKRIETHVMTVSPFHSVVKTHQKSCSTLDPVVCRHLARPQVNGHHKGGPASHTRAIGVVVTWTTVDTYKQNNCTQLIKHFTGAGKCWVLQVLSTQYLKAGPQRKFRDNDNKHATFLWLMSKVYAVSSWTTGIN